jgi:hypothetical protein
LGAKDPHSNAFSQVDFRLKRQLCHYSKADDPPHQVKPVPIQVLTHALDLAHAHMATLRALRWPR